MEIHVACPYWRVCEFKQAQLQNGVCVRSECCILNDNPEVCRLIGGFYGTEEGQTPQNKQEDE